MTAKAGSLEVCMAQKANMEAIFHSVADGILTVDNERRVVNVNQAAAEMLGLPEDEATGRPVAEVLPGRVWDVEELLAETLATGRATRGRENLIEGRGGRELRVLLTTSRLYDLTGEVGGAVVVVRDVTHVRELEVRLEQRTRLHSIVGKSHAMQEMFRLVEQVAPTDSTVLIQGESGTGKELVADAIHRSSRRADGPFVKVNCSALSEGLLESELFGHVKGAFTGALHDRKGRFELADGGTLLLDEVGDLPERIQVKLLRVLQEREIERVGDNRVRSVDVRILAATHRPLRRLVEEGRFRQDLFYRLHVIPIRVLPLRDRREDIPELVAAFVADLAPRSGKDIDRVSPDALRVLMDHRWPGNVRELRNAIEHAVVKGRGPLLLVEDLPRELIEESAGVARLARRPVPAASGPGGAPDAPGADAERERLLEALERTAWNRTEAAALLGINRSTLWRKMKRFGLGRR
jgi:PAS domain S-box-containing protein